MKVCEKCGCINHGSSTHCTDCGALLRLKEQDDSSVAEMVERQMDTEHRLVPSGFETGFAWVCLGAAAVTFAAGWLPQNRGWHTLAGLLGAVMFLLAGYLARFPARQWEKGQFWQQMWIAYPEKEEPSRLWATGRRLLYWFFAAIALAVLPVLLAGGLRQKPEIQPGITMPDGTFRPLPFDPASAPCQNPQLYTEKTCKIM